MHQAQLTAYYKDTKNVLHNFTATIATDPEGVTEEDVQRLQQEVVIALASDNTIYKSPIMVLVKGGKV